MPSLMRIAVPLSLSLLPSALSSASPEDAAATIACGGPGGTLGACDADASTAGLGLLQMESRKHHVPAAQVEGSAAATRSNEERELVLQHIPYNFGHTIEKIAAYGSGQLEFAKYTAVATQLDKPQSTAARWALVNSSKRQGAELWGHINPDLFAASEVTGCPLFFTPGKYWPKEVAESYFGNKTIFGMLRDPYERLTAMFRGNFGDYGGSYPEFFKTCDVNGAVRKMMTDYLAGDIYSGECCFIPQAEYFEGPFGISLPVDNRRFPDSMNEAFTEHGYSNMHIATDDVLHVNGCPEVWAGDLDCETKALVKKVYARDFELLCKHFGYCDHDENCCISGVPLMCPSNLAAKRETATYCA